MRLSRTTTTGAGLPAHALLLAASLLFAAPAAAQQIGLALGERPEPVVLEDLAGESVDLGEYMGRRPVVIEFWAEWCPLCAELAPRIEAARRRFGDRADFLVVAVGVNQSVRKVRRHAERHPLPGRVLWDGRGRAARAFNAPSTSYVVILDAAGRVAYTGVGSDQPIASALARVLEGS